MDPFGDDMLHRRQLQHNWLHTLLFKVGTRRDETGITTVRKRIGFRHQTLRLFIFKEHVGTALRHRQNQHWHHRQPARKCPSEHNALVQL